MTPSPSSTTVKRSTNVLTWSWPTSTRSTPRRSHLRRPTHLLQLGSPLVSVFGLFFYFFSLTKCAFRCAVPDFFFLPSSFTQACAALQSRLLPSRSSCCMVFADYDVSTPCARSSGLLSSADCQFSRASPFASCLHHHPPLAPSPSRHSSGGLLAT